MVTWATTLILVSGILHLVLTPVHLAEARGQGIFFIVLGILQVGWAITYLRRPTSAAYLAGLALMVVMPVVAYVGARFVTPPFSDGPEAWDIIGVGTLVAEAGAGILLAWHGLGSAYSWAGRRLKPVPTLLAALGAGLVVAGIFYGLGMAAGAAFPSLSEPEEGHHSGAIEAAPEDHHSGASGAGPEGHHAAAMVASPSIVGMLPYDGPTDGAGIQAACSPQTGQEAIPCYTAALKALLVGRGAIEAYAALDELTTLDAAVNAQSHAVAHDVGRFAYEAYGRDIGLTLSSCSYEVFQGCLHGSQQAYFDDIAAIGGTVDGQVVGSTCPTPKNRFQEYACLHGLGHGIMLYTNYAMNQSLALCDALSTSFAAQSCYGGVFMENLVGYLDSKSPTAAGGHHGKGGHTEPPSFMADPSNPTYPCDVVDTKYRGTCWMMQTSLILHFNGGDFAAGSTICNGAGESRLNCYQSLGRDAAPYTGPDPPAMVQHCSYGPEDARTACIKGFTAESILNYNSPAAGVSLCMALPAEAKTPCYQETGSQAANMLDPDLVQSLCETAEANFVEACKEAGTR